MVGLVVVTMGRLDRAVEAVERASLEQLMRDYPAEWSAIGPKLVDASKQGPQALHALMQAARAQAAPWRERWKKSHGNPQVLQSALPALVRERLVRLAVEEVLQRAATGVEEGPVRLGWWSGLLVQRLLFARGLERKPASLGAFRALWPLVFDRRKVMPLVQQRGVYCFYSSALVDGLARLVGPRPCVEVAAGDGTLSRFLRARGVDVRATDDFSWSHAVTYPDDVERLDAAAALARYQPRVVLSSFPPPGNAFERKVLAAPHVELYVVVTTAHRFAAGDWDAYDASPRLTRRADEGLSRAVLPPEVDPLVLIFEEKQPVA